MTEHQLVHLVVTITLVEMMVAVGLGVAAHDVIAAIRDWRRLLRTAAVNYVIVPAAALLLVELFPDPGTAAVGLFLVAAFPGASYGPPFTKFARGNLSLAVGLTTLLAGSSAVVGPLVLRALMSLTRVKTTIDLDIAKIAGVVALTQLLPLTVGMAIRHYAPNRARKWQTPGESISKILNGCTIVCVLTLGRSPGSPFRFVGPVAMLLLLLTSLLAGYLVGGPERESRKAVALTTSLRNIGVSIMVVSGHFADASMLSTVLGYAIVELTGTLVLALWWGWRQGGFRPAQV